MAVLYIVSTPIGNLEDITLRALKVLFSVPVIAAEDTRRTGNLLDYFRKKENLLSEVFVNQFQIFNPINPSQPPLEKGRSNSPPYEGGVRGDLTEQAMRMAKPRYISFHEHNENQKIEEILQLLKDGVDVALVSDGGTPLVSDPGFKLVREAVSKGVKVESIPGPSAAVAALTVSGLPTDKFLFVGYLPKKDGKRKNFLQSLRNSHPELISGSKIPKQVRDDKKGFIKLTIIFYESPFRIVKMLESIKEVFGDIDIVICRELTKLHEGIRREKVSESILNFTKVAPKGEFVILF